jgi:hypothetical protein
MLFTTKIKLQSSDDHIQSLKAKKPNTCKAKRREEVAER